MKASPNKAALLLAGWLTLTNLLVWGTQITDAWPLKVLVFICLAFLPGAALLRALRIIPHSLLEGLVYCLGLSILVLMLSGLAANQILFALGVSRPLELPGIWGALNIVIVLCIAAGAFFNRETLRFELSWPSLSKTTCLMLVAASLVPVIATFGAFRLNNGGDALVAGIAIGWATGLLALALLLRNRLGDGTLAWCIFAISLAVLLMTALRSWDISGHDIAREFRVYTLTHFHGRWNIDAYRDPYNACLSITILPEVFAKLMRISGLTAFRVILQVIFAACPVVIYVMLRRHASKLGALLGCGLFISYPTFINDSAMLTRQGVAYLFFSLALLTALRLPHEKVHKSLFLLFGLGVILSHYSTSYMFVAIFAIALACKLSIQLVRRWRLTIRGDKFAVLTPGVFVFVALATFLWYGQITATATGLVVTLTRSVTNIPNLLSDDNKSADTSSALLFAAHKSQLDIYQSYLARPELSNDIVEAPLYKPEISSDNIPVTALGQRLSGFGIEPTITADSRQHFAKVLQLLAGLSVFYATYLSVFYTTYVFTRKKRSLLPLDLICLTVAGIVLLAVMVVLPNLSLSYGVLRTFQQSLIFLVIPLTLLLTIVGRVLRPGVRVAVATVGMTALFFLFTGLFAQLLGGVSASLTLNNHGPYYGLYYTTKADLQAYAWMKAHIPHHSDVRAASFQKAIMHDPNYPFSKVGILPTQRPTSSYVYLDPAQVVAQKFYVYHDGSPLITTFPTNYYHDQTNQIYSTTTTGVYH